MSRGLLRIPLVVFLFVLVVNLSIYAGALVNQDDASPVNTITRYRVEPKYSYIRSYRGGGGIFILYLVPRWGFQGNVELSMNADPNLNAQLDITILNSENTVAELTIQPNDNVDIQVYTITVVATQLQEQPSEKPRTPAQTIELQVDIYEWFHDEHPFALEKRDEFLRWLEQEHPEFGVFTGQNCSFYMTYPGILVVEHWTFLYEDWEMRFCFHVMMYPYNWSMICLRHRGEVKAEFAARREYVFPTLSVFSEEPHGTPDLIYREIPVSEYPMFFGY